MVVLSGQSSLKEALIKILVCACLVNLILNGTGSV